MFSLFLQHLSHYAPTLYAWPPLAVSLLITALGVVVLQREDYSPISLVFFLLTVTTAIWLFSFAAMYSTRNITLIYQWTRIEHLGVIFVPPMVYAFALAVVKLGRRHSTSLFASLVISCLFYTGLVQTPWFVTGLYRYPWGFYPHYGPLSIPFVVFFAVVLCRSLAVLYAAYRDATPGRRKQRLKLFAVALGLGYLGAIDFLPAYGVPVYPAGYLPVLIFLVTLAFAVWRYGLVDITPAFVAPRVLSTMARPLLVLDADLHVSLVNKATCKMFQRSEQELLEADIHQLVPGFFTPETIQRLLTAGPIEDQALPSPANAPERFWEMVSASVIRDERQAVLAYVCLLRDKTQQQRREDQVRAYSQLANRSVVEREQAVQARRDSEDRLRLLINAVKDYAIFMLDEQGIVASWNRGAERIKGYRAEEIIGRHFSVFYPEEDIERGKPEALLKKALEEGESHDVGWRVRKDGTPFWADVLTTAVWDSSGRLRGFAKVTRDITEEMQLRKMSFRDELTGLYNRRGFLTLAQQDLRKAQRDNKPLLLILADLDGLKPINDTFGHPEGDLAIKNAAGILQKTFRDSDIVARIGGDEFAVLARDDSPGDSPALERLEARLRELNAAGPMKYRLGISCGVKHLNPSDKTPFKDLIRQADKELYEKKRAKKALASHGATP